MKVKALFAAAALAVGLAGSAQSAVVQFSGQPSTSWADGTFSTNLSGWLPDGFYGVTATSAYNGFGQNGESISWNSATTLNSLELENYIEPYGVTSLTASLYDSSNNLLASKTIVPTASNWSTLTFNTPDVSKLTLSFTGGSDIYGDGRNAAWYFVSNVTYGDAAAVPEPATWAMLLLGFGGIGAAMRMGRRKEAMALAAA